MPFNNDTAFTATLRTLNLVYTGLSFVSFGLSVPALALTCFICRSKANVTATVKHTEELFALASVVLMSATAFEILQWVYLLKGNSAGCALVGALHQYGVMVVLVFGGCVGAHLVGVMRRPKCLMVIEELKQKRYRQMTLVYGFTTFLLPLLFVPWPVFVGKSYGPYDYKCWLNSTSAYVSAPRNDSTVIMTAVNEALLMHAWAVLVALFGTASVSYSYITLYCRSTKLTYHVCAVTCGMMGVLTTTFLNVAAYVVLAVQGREAVTLLYVTAIWAPLQFILAGVAFMSRSCVVGYVRFRRRQYTPIGHPPPGKQVQNAFFRNTQP